jgi:hypothetical protein
MGDGDRIGTLEDYKILMARLAQEKDDAWHQERQERFNKEQEHKRKQEEFNRQAEHKTKQEEFNRKMERERYAREEQDHWRRQDEFNRQKERERLPGERKQPPVEPRADEKWDSHRKERESPLPGPDDFRGVPGFPKY